jgi:hypothetical protein
MFKQPQVGDRVRVKPGGWKLTLEGRKEFPSGVGIVEKTFRVQPDNMRSEEPIIDQDGTILVCEVDFYNYKAGLRVAKPETIYAHILELADD